MECGQKARTKNIHPSREELWQLYVVEDKTGVEIAKLYGMHNTTLLTRLRERGITIRTNTEIHGGKVNSVETREKMSKGAMGNQKWLGRKHSVAARAKISEAHLGMMIPLDVRQKMSATHKKLFENPEHKNRILRAVQAAWNIHPNKPETIVGNLLNEIDPNHWEFVGDGKIVMGGRIPDYYNVNGQKKIIEVFGDYWHGERARCYEETEEGRIAHFKQFGHDVLVIWESELKEPDKVTLRIKEFIKKGGSHEKVAVGETK